MTPRPGRGALDGLVGHLGEPFHRGRPVHLQRPGARGPAQLLAPPPVDGQRSPGRRELAFGPHQHPRLAVHHRVTQPRHVEGNRGGTANRRLGDHDAPAFDQRRVHQQPRRAQQPVLLLLRHPPGEHHARSGLRLQPRALRPVPGDHQLPADHVPHPVPQPQQQIEALVIGEPGQAPGTAGPASAPSAGRAGPRRCRSAGSGPGRLPSAPVTAPWTGTRSGTGSCGAPRA